jgi:hypothetical protein
MRLMMLSAVLALAPACAFSSSPAFAFTLMTWNVGEGSVESVTRRRGDSAVNAFGLLAAGKAFTASEW